MQMGSMGEIHSYGEAGIRPVNHFSTVSKAWSGQLLDRPCADPQQGSKFLLMVAAPCEENSVSIIMDSTIKWHG